MNKSSSSDLVRALEKQGEKQLSGGKSGVGHKEGSSLWRSCVFVLSLAGLLDSSAVDFVQDQRAVQGFSITVMFL